MGSFALRGHKYVINWIYTRWYRPEDGWDPIPKDYAEHYANDEWQNLDCEVIAQLEQWTGGLQGKRLLDLGGGPGQYSVAFAKRGALVTWHDVSRNYLEIAQAKAREHDVHITFSLGYLEDAERYVSTGFDVVFNRICWYYGRGDRSFARLLYQLVRPGGVGYVDVPIAQRSTQLTRAMRLRTWINTYTYFKIGHPFPPRGRAAALFQRYPLSQIHIDYRLPGNDRIFFIRAG